MFFLDLDGVFVDFHGTMLEHGFDVDGVDRDECWDFLIANYHLWETMKPLNGYQNLFKAIVDKGIDIAILTGGVGDYEKCGNYKEKWVQKYLRPLYHKDIPFYCINSKDKWHFARTGYLLIDDKESNIEKWNKIGGTGILHKNNTESIEYINNMVIPVFGKNKVEGYSGYLIPQEIRQLIFDKFSPKLGLKDRFVFICDHVTRSFPVKYDIPEKAHVTIKAYGYNENDTHQVLFVEVDGQKFRKDGKRYHVTIALDNSENSVKERGQKVSAFESNNLEPLLFKSDECFEWKSTYALLDGKEKTQPVKIPQFRKITETENGSITELIIGDIVTITVKNKNGELYNQEGPIILRKNMITNEILFEKYGPEYENNNKLSI